MQTADKSLLTVFFEAKDCLLTAAYLARQEGLDGAGFRSALASASEQLTLLNEELNGAGEATGKGVRDWPDHPAGLRPVAYQWGGRNAEYRRGWLVSLCANPDGANVLVETDDGQILEVDTPAVRFMDRGQALPAASSVPLALSV